jgi:hypothetical protein
LRAIMNMDHWEGVWNEAQRLAGHLGI